MIVSKVWIWSSVLIAIFVSISSLLGIMHPLPYAQETANWALQAVGQDVGNLIAVPVFLYSTYSLSKNSKKAFFLWAGSLLYFIYAYLVYAFFIHFNFLFLVYVAVLGLSSYTLIGGLVQQNTRQTAESLLGKSFQSANATLVVIGTLFSFLWLSEIIPAILTGEPPQSVITAGLWVNPIHVIDLALVLPGMILTGFLLWRKKLLGYLFAAPWLAFSVLMGCGIVATLLLELSAGNQEALIPLLMVGMVVASSAVALSLYLQEVTEADEE